jgi:hypothetical protein
MPEYRPELQEWQIGQLTREASGSMDSLQAVYNRLNRKGYSDTAEEVLERVSSLDLL